MSLFMLAWFVNIERIWISEQCLDKKSGYISIYIWYVKKNIQQGNSNSLATIDISAGFVGVTSYRPFVHGALIATQTFGGTFLTYLSYLMHIISRDAQKERYVCSGKVLDVGI